MSGAGARVVGLQVSGGGVPKLPIHRAAVGVNGMEGDRQRNRRFHGGPTRALCLYAQELLDALAAEGHPVARGVLGENVTIEGVSWASVRPGVRLRLGEVEIEVTAYAAPCQQIASAFSGGEFTRIGQKVRPGWSRVYARVLRPGTLSVFDDAELLAVVTHE